MKEKLPTSIKVVAENCVNHLQGIAVDSERRFIYCSFTTRLLKADMNGNVVGSVTGLAGHLGCIAYNYADGKVYGSLEYKRDSIGKGIMRGLGRDDELEDGFYVVRFDVEKIDRMDMDAECDGVMEAMYLREVVDDYSAEGHRLGCSGIDGITIAPPMGEDGECDRIYVAYGVYGDTSRDDNDHQVILCYPVSDLDTYAAPLDQHYMHKSGPAAPERKYFVYTGNTIYGVQNLEYDPYTETILAAVYPGKKDAFPNYSMYFIDRTVSPLTGELRGVGGKGEMLSLTLPSGGAHDEICGSRFPDGSTGMASLGGGLYYFARAYRGEDGQYGVIKLYELDREENGFKPIE